MEEHGDTREDNGHGGQTCQEGGKEEGRKSEPRKGNILEERGLHLCAGM